MARTPRHSKPKSSSITIDLDDKDVKPIEDDIRDDGQEDVQDNAENQESTTAEDAPAQNTLDENNADEVTTPSDEKLEGDKTTSPKGGSGSTFSAGIIGGVLALIGAFGLQWAGILPGANNTQSEAVTALEEKIVGLEKNLGQTSNQIAEQLTLQPTGDFSSLTIRVDELETLLQNDNASSLEALNEIRSQIDQLTSKIINVETIVENIGTGEGINGADGNALSEGITSELSKLSALNIEQADKITDLQAQIISLAQSSSQNTEMSQIITQLQKRLADAETAIAEPSNEISIARSLAATTVKSAINRGGSFVAELEAFAQIDPEHAAIAELRPLSEKGVATRAELISGFGAIANQIIAADSAIEGDTDIMTRLLNSAASMVKVRKIGEIEGDSAEAITARIETRLNDGKLIDAAREWEKLSDKAKAASQAFQIQLTDRIQAEQLSDKLMQAAPANAG